MEAQRSASQEEVWPQWPRYRDAALGFRNFWYPVMVVRRLGSKPVSITLCGERIALVRERGQVYGLGGDPVAGKTYPVEERAGLIWVYVGEQPPPPVEADIPEELLQPDAAINALFELRKGNWRYAFENGMDEGHGKYLHRNTPWFFFRELPIWTRGVTTAPSPDGRWLMRVRGQSRFEDVYPRLGRYPKRKDFWRSRGRGSTELAARLPCLLRVRQRGWTDYEIFVPVDADHHLAVFLAVRWTSGLGAWLWRLRYWLYVRWIYYGLLNRAEDQWMVEFMDIPPEKLYRPDISITAWRRWCEERVREREEQVKAADIQREKGPAPARVGIG